MSQKDSVLRKPEWLKIKLQNTQDYSYVSKIVESNGLHTICSSGKCPNMSECWSRGTATFMILGNICTRSCKFCATVTGKPLELDVNEPSKIANSIHLMRLKHCVITSVDRDDLLDGGAEIWAATIRAIRAKNPEVTIEVLIPDFDGREDLLNIVISAKPDIIGHNIETVRRLTPFIRSRAKYDLSLSVIAHISKSGIVSKSGLMLGLGESDSEILSTLDDLRESGCQIVTIGQYLQPTKSHLKVESYIHPDVFDSYRVYGEGIGFSHIESAPMVRSSYMADKAINSVKKKINLGNR